MDGVFLFSDDGSSFVDRVANNIHNPSQSFRANGDADGCASVDDILASDQTLSGIHSDGSDPGISEMLGNFEHQPVFDSFDLEGVEDGRDVSLELDIYDCADDLGDLSLFEGGCSLGGGEQTGSP